MNNLKKLTNLHLIWIEHQGFWVYKCQNCQQIQLERKAKPCWRLKEVSC